MFLLVYPIVSWPENDILQFFFFSRITTMREEDILGSVAVL